MIYLHVMIYITISIYHGSPRYNTALVELYADLSPDTYMTRKYNVVYPDYKQSYDTSTIVITHYGINVMSSTCVTSIGHSCILWYKLETYSYVGE